MNTNFEKRWTMTMTDAHWVWCVALSHATQPLTNLKYRKNNVPWQIFSDLFVQFSALIFFAHLNLFRRIIGTGYSLALRLMFIKPKDSWLRFQCTCFDKSVMTIWFWNNNWINHRKQLEAYPHYIYLVYNIFKSKVLGIIFQRLREDPG